MKNRKEATLLAAFAALMIIAALVYLGVVPGPDDGDDPATHPRLSAGSENSTLESHHPMSYDELIEHGLKIVGDIPCVQ